MATSSRPDTSAARGSHPAAFHYGAGHVVMYANPAFEAEFGRSCLGQPAREVMLAVPHEAFEVMDLVLRGGKPLARRVLTAAGPRRIVVAPRIDPETGEVYGVTSHLVAL
jgi:PAS domain-containing protein